MVRIRELPHVPDAQGTVPGGIAGAPQYFQIGVLAQIIVYVEDRVQIRVEALPEQQKVLADAVVLFGVINPPS